MWNVSSNVSDESTVSLFRVEGDGSGFMRHAVRPTHVPDDTVSEARNLNTHRNDISIKRSYFNTIQKISKVTIFKL
jgi:hypothetical protein